MTPSAGTSATEHYNNLFAAHPLAGLPAWLPPLKRAAQSKFAELGFPRRDDEEWRFTDVRAIAEIPFRTGGAVANGASICAAHTFPGIAQIVFVNGRYSAELSTVGSLPAGVIVEPLSETLRSNSTLLEPHLGRYAEFTTRPFAALNTALFEEGAFVYIPARTAIEHPMHLVYLSTGGDVVTQPRTLVVAEEHSQATIVENYGSVGRSLTNAVTEIYLAQNAVVDHYKLQREDYSAFHISQMDVRLNANAVFSSHNFAFGGAISRSDITAVLAGEHIECTLNGLYMADGSRVVDNHTSIDHAMPNCDSHEVYKGILNGTSRGVFNGKIFVRQDAQKTDAKQTNRTLLLSEGAQINTKPQLEIFADDVKCTHGATIGQLDASQMFYLRTRGIPEAAARAILVYAFAGDIVTRVKVAPLREALDAEISARLTS